MLCGDVQRQLLPIAAREGPALRAVHYHGCACTLQMEDGYNQDFMRAAHILFTSDEPRQAPSEPFIKQLRERYHNEVIVIGMGTKATLLPLHEEKTLQVLAVTGLPVANTIDARDGSSPASSTSTPRTRTPQRRCSRRWRLQPSYWRGIWPSRVRYQGGVMLRLREQLVRGYTVRRRRLP